jgi:hypothetical protein
MKSITSHRLALIILLALTLIAAGPASPAAIGQTFSFDVGSTFGDRDRFTFQVNRAGCIVAEIASWSRSGTRGSPASQLALILNGSDRSGYYARRDGAAPLRLSYSVSSSEVRRVRTWTISVVNFTKSGTARGTINLEHPPNNLRNCR